MDCAFDAPLAESHNKMRTRAATQIFLLIAPLAVLMLLAATPARNSDLWLHLAAGRNRIEKPADFASSTYTANQTVEVQPSWLVDVQLYCLFVVGGGLALMLWKALTILRVNDTQVGDAGLENLKGLPKLKRVFAQDAKVTEGGAENFKKAAPSITLMYP